MQLGLELPARKDAAFRAPPMQVPQGEELGRLVGDGIDGEAQGRTDVASARADAALMADALKAAGRARVAVIMPMFGLPLREQDALFVEGLAADPELEVAWLEITPQVPATSLDAIYPTLASGSDFPVAEESRLHLPGGAVAVAPWRRENPSAVPRSQFDRLATMPGIDGWTRAYAMRFGHNLYADCAELSRVAIAAQAAGAVDLSLDLYAHGALCATSINDKAVSLARMQGLRIASHRFREAAAAPTVNRAAPAPLKSYIEAMRAWGQVMTGMSAEARRFLEDVVAEIDGKPRPSLYDLYLLNIAALRRMRDGDIAGAAQLEDRIACFRGAGIDDPRLAYVNLLNLSRLARRAGEHRAGRELHRAAFATVWGIASPWEVFHYELLEALSADQIGDDSRAPWVRASLIWLSDACPAAVPLRAIRALLGPGLLPEDAPGLVARVDRALEAQLERHASLSGKPIEARFTRISRARAPDIAVESPVAAFALALQRDHGAGPDHAPGLRACVARALGIEDGGTLLIDAGAGYAMPRGKAGALSIAMRYGAVGMRLGNGEARLDEPFVERLADRAKIERNPAILSIQALADEEALVTYKRRLPARRVSGACACAMSRLDRALPLRTLHPRATEAFSFAARLEDEGLARLEFDLPA